MVGERPLVARSRRSCAKAAPGFVNNQERAEPYRLARVDSITPNTRILQKGLTLGDGYVRAANIVRIKDALKARNS